MALIIAAPTFPIPPSWLNQKLELYHGTIDVHGYAILVNVNVALGRSATDFGRGFYTTTDLTQARSWAARMNARHPHHPPVVVKVTLDRDVLAGLDGLWFVRGDPGADDYWSLVRHCRTGAPDHARSVHKGWYDVVIGPLASNWKARSSFSNADQISFHTTEAEIELNNAPRMFVP